MSAVGGGHWWRMEDGYRPRRWPVLALMPDLKCAKPPPPNAKSFNRYFRPPVPFSSTCATGSTPHGQDSKTTHGDRASVVST